MHLAELGKAELLGEVGIERDLRAAGVDEEDDLLAAIHPHADDRQRAGGVDEFEPRDLAVALQFIGRLAFEALKRGDVQGRILLGDELVSGNVDAVECGSRLLEVVAAIECLRQHDFGVGVVRL